MHGHGHAAAPIRPYVLLQLQQCYCLWKCSKLTQSRPTEQRGLNRSTLFCTEAIPPSASIQSFCQTCSQSIVIRRQFDRFYFVSGSSVIT